MENVERRDCLLGNGTVGMAGLTLDLGVDHTLTAISISVNMYNPY